MLSVDGRSVGVSETPSTARRAQKRLFTSENSATKRNLFCENRISSPGGGNSGDESDLGPMSPLALSDATPSSAANSPALTFDSPLGLRVSVPPVSHSSLDTTLWDKSVRNESRDKANAATSSPFSVLKMLTRSARYSQHRKLCPPSPEPVPTFERESGEAEIMPTTPKRSDKSLPWNESITETPKRRFGREIQNDQMAESEIVEETPQKEDSPDKRLITPLGSVSKEAALPRLHHRKSLNNLALDGNSSPIDVKENILKRTAREAIVSNSAKLLKSDECPSVPKARAALFQETKKKEEFKLSTKSFYGSLPRSSKVQDLSTSFEKSEVCRGQKRRSLPARISRGRSIKRHRYGEINAGVGHGIKRPKLKRHVSRAEAFKKEKNEKFSPKSASVSPLHCQPNSSVDNISQNFGNILSDTDTKILPKEREKSPEIDPKKKFFKTNRTIARNSPATVTVNDTIKLQVSNGKLKLEPKLTMRRRIQRTKPKNIDLSFDANDLTVDDPTFSVPINGTSVDNILKVLEDDWADDEYDTMESLTTKHMHAISPLKSSSIPPGVTMSPASELSSMTSVMNIEDVCGLNSKANCVSSNVAGNGDKETKLYPLFNQKFTANKSLIETSKKGLRGTRTPTGWQLPTKNGKRDESQYQLDVGQKRFGATQCPQCGVLYQIGEPEDERSHRNYHDSVKILKFSGWKQERVVGEDPYTASRIILVEPGDPKHCWKKVSEILTVVDKDLGLADSQPSDYHNDKIYLYIRDKEIIGVLVAEYVSAGHRMIPDLIDINCCSLESSVVKCGVKVVWTTMSRRRQGVATKLMDVLRANFYFGYVLAVDDIAFSIPTPGGKAFAEKYTKSRCFKVYN